MTVLFGQPNTSTQSAGGIDNTHVWIAKATCTKSSTIGFACFLCVENGVQFKWSVYEDGGESASTLIQAGVATSQTGYMYIDISSPNFELGVNYIIAIASQTACIAYRDQMAGESVWYRNLSEYTDYATLEFTASFDFSAYTQLATLALCACVTDEAPPLNNVLVFSGDSRHSTSYANSPQYHVLSAIRDVERCSVSICGHPTYTIAQINSAWATTEAALSLPDGETSWCVINAGWNDCEYEVETATSISGLTTLINNALGLFDKVCLLTVAPDFLDSGKEALRDALNENIRSRASSRIKIVDQDLDAVLIDHTNTQAYSDGVHHEAYGGARLADLIVSATRMANRIAGCALTGEFSPCIADNAYIGRIYIPASCDIERVGIRANKAGSCKIALYAGTSSGATTLIEDLGEKEAELGINIFDLTESISCSVGDYLYVEISSDDAVASYRTPGGSLQAWSSKEITYASYTSPSPASGYSSYFTTLELCAFLVSKAGVISTSASGAYSFFNLIHHGFMP